MPLAADSSQEDEKPVGVGLPSEHRGSHGDTDGRPAEAGSAVSVSGVEGRSPGSPRAGLSGSPQSVFAPLPVMLPARPERGSGIGRGLRFRWSDFSWGRILTRVLPLLVLVVLAAATAAVIAALMQKASADSENARSAAATYVSSAAPSLVSGRPIVVAIGATDLLGRDSSGSMALEWPARLAQSLSVRSGSFPESSERLASLSVAGAVRLARQFPDGTAVIVVAVGSDDVPTASADGVSRLLDAARSGQPGARLVVVGPLRGVAVATRSELRSVAQSFGARWIDPVSAGWFTGAGASPDPEVLTATTAERLEALVRPMLRSSSSN